MLSIVTKYYKKYYKVLLNKTTNFEKNWLLIHSIKIDKQNLNEIGLYQCLTLSRIVVDMSTTDLNINFQIF